MIAVSFLQRVARVAAEQAFALSSRTEIQPVRTHKFGPRCADQGGTLAQRRPAPLAQERYGNHDGFVEAVKKAAHELVKERFLLEVDAETDIGAAQASTVLK